MDITHENMHELEWLPDTGEPSRSISFNHIRSDAFLGWIVILKDDSGNSTTKYFDQPCGVNGIAHNSTRARNQDGHIARMCISWMAGDSTEDAIDHVDGWTSSYTG